MMLNMLNDEKMKVKRMEWTASMVGKVLGRGLSHEALHGVEKGTDVLLAVVVVVVVVAVVGIVVVVAVVGIVVVVAVGGIVVVVAVVGIVVVEVVGVSVEIVGVVRYLSVVAESVELLRVVAL